MDIKRKGRGGRIFDVMLMIAVALMVIWGDTQSSDLKTQAVGDFSDAADSIRKDIVLFLTESDFDSFGQRRSGVQFVKLVVRRGALDTLADDDVYFFDASVYPLHMDFVRHNLMGVDDGLENIQRESWGDESRRFIFANLAVYEGKDGSKRFTLELFEKDGASPALLSELFTLVKARCFVGSALSFRPNSLEQAALTPQLRALGVQVFVNGDLNGSRLFLVQNAGRPAVGRLRVVEDDDPIRVQEMTFNNDEIVVLSTIPNDISRVAGIITDSPTTPLSHVNLRARSWGIPNVMIRDVESRVWREGYAGQWMYLAVGDNGIPVLRYATDLEIVAAQERRQNKPKFVVPRVDLSDASLGRLSSLRQLDLPKYGAKAANLGEVSFLLKNLSLDDLQAAVDLEGAILPGQLSQAFFQSALPKRGRPQKRVFHRLSGKRRAKSVLGAFEVPQAFVLPFGAYAAFLNSPENKGIGLMIHMLLEDPLFRSDPEHRKIKLKALRLAISEGVFPKELAESVVGGLQKLQGKGPVFVRSSTNSEDLVGFNGAGLYDTVGPVDRREVIESIKTVWASIWNFRAFEARSDFGIDHLSVFPGVLIQRGIEADVAGVMLTRDIFDAEDQRRTYINANPGPGQNVVEEGMRPAQLYINRESGLVERIALSASSAAPVLTDEQARQLTYMGAFLEAHFSRLYGKGPMPLDIEWVISEGRIYIVQARPYL